jgi:hypothetical protein
MSEMRLVERIVAIGSALDDAGLPHAFGGALALAWCTQRARGTIDIDVNVFVPASRTDEVLASLPNGVACDERSRRELLETGQARLWWDATPVDVFLDTTEFHEQAALRTRREQFAGHDIAFLGCSDLAVFKAFFDRTKDWADLEEMMAAGTLDVARVAGTLAQYLGVDDPRVARLLTLAERPR